MYHSSGSSSNQSRTALRSFVSWGVIALRDFGRFNVSSNTCFAGNESLSSDEWCGGWRCGIWLTLGEGRRSFFDTGVSRLYRHRYWPVDAIAVRKHLRAPWRVPKGPFSKIRCGDHSPTKSRNPATRISYQTKSVQLPHQRHFFTSSNASTRTFIQEKKKDKILQEIEWCWYIYRRY